MSYNGTRDRLLDNAVRSIRWYYTMTGNPDVTASRDKIIKEYSLGIASESELRQVPQIMKDGYTQWYDTVEEVMGQPPSSVIVQLERDADKEKQSFNALKLILIFLVSFSFITILWL